MNNMTPEDFTWIIVGVFMLVLLAIVLRDDDGGVA